MVVVSAGHVGGTCGSGIVSSIAEVQGLREVVGVCEMCMCRAPIYRAMKAFCIHTRKHSKPAD